MNVGELWWTSRSCFLHNCFLFELNSTPVNRRIPKRIKRYQPVIIIEVEYNSADSAVRVLTPISDGWIFKVALIRELPPNEIINEQKKY